jgi:hypothetical protein
VNISRYGRRDRGEKEEGAEEAQQGEGEAQEQQE